MSKRKMMGSLPSRRDWMLAFKAVRRTIADTAREERVFLDVPQIALADDLGIEKTTLSNLECGAGDPVLSTVVRVLDRLGYRLVIERRQ